MEKNPRTGGFRSCRGAYMRVDVYGEPSDCILSALNIAPVKGCM